jgi:hypothetical protein
MKGNIWKKGKLNSEKIWKIWKISVLVILHPKIHPPLPPPPLPPYSSSSSAAATAALLLLRRHYIIALKFHPKHITSKSKTKHIMKISHINITYDKYATSQQNSD